MKTLTERLSYTSPRKKEVKNWVIVYLLTKTLWHLRGNFCFDDAALLSVYAGTLFRIVSVTLSCAATNLLTNTDGPKTHDGTSSNIVTRSQYWIRYLSDSIHLSFSVHKARLIVNLPVLYRPSKWLFFKMIYHLIFVVIFTRYIVYFVYAS